MFITFSGLDGAGKTTLIESLAKALKSRGHQVALRTMYYDISFYSFVRKIRDRCKKKLGMTTEQPSSSAVNPGGIGINPHDPKIDVSDKTGIVSKWIYRIIRRQVTRKIFLFLDLLIFLLYRFKEELVQRRILITDRYLYDSLVDVADLQGRNWFFIRLFLLISPTPRVPILVDVDAKTAFERKREYHLEYLQWRRKAYHQLFGMVGNSMVLVNDNLEASVKNLQETVLKRIENNHVF